MIIFRRVSGRLDKQQFVERRRRWRCRGRLRKLKGGEPEFRVNDSFTPDIPVVRDALAQDNGV